MGFTIFLGASEKSKISPAAGIRRPISKTKNPVTKLIELSRVLSFVKILFSSDTIFFISICVTFQVFLQIWIHYTDFLLRSEITAMRPTSLHIIRRWADKFCLHCNIFIYSRHIWIKPVLCSRMVSLFHHTTPWTHRCLQSSPRAHRKRRVFRRSVQTACCYWIHNRGKSSSNWNSQTNASPLRWSVC